MKKETSVRVLALCITFFTIALSSIIYLGKVNVKRTLLLLAIAIVLSFCVILIDKYKKNNLLLLLDKKIWKISYLDAIAYLLITVFSVVVRIKFCYFESADYTIFLGKWVDQFRELGWHSLGCNIGNYSPFYTTLLIAISMTELDKLVTTRILSIVFDYVLSFACVSLYNETTEKKSIFKSILVYSAVILNPIVVLNSSAWSQADSIYSSFIILAVWAFFRAKKDKNLSYEWIFIFFGFAFAMKFQAVLTLPALLLFVFTSKDKRVSLTQLIWIPIVYLLSSLPMMFMGRSLKDCILVYFMQAGEYTNYLTMRYYNMFILLGNPQSEINEGLFWFGAFVAIGVVGLIYYAFLKMSHQITSEKILLLVAVTVLAMVFFLPSMHERYAYVGEVILVILAVKNRKYIVPAIATVICTLLSYAEYLSADMFALSTCGRVMVSVFRLLIIIVLLKHLFTDSKRISKEQI